MTDWTPRRGVHVIRLYASAIGEFNLSFIPAVELDNFVDTANDPVVHKYYDNLIHI